MTDIRSKMAAGAVWMVLAKLTERSLGLISMLILARVLVPADFGIVAMAMSFVALLELLGAFGFETALVQRQTNERACWDTAWTFNVILGFAIGALMAVFAGPVATFFKEPALVDVLRVLAIGSALQGLQNVGLVAFRTEMQFDREFRFLAAKKLIGFVITVPLAILLDSYWALVIGQTAARGASTALSYWVHPYRPRLTLAAANVLFGFSKWMFLLNIIHYAQENAANLVIGRIAGPGPLGGFNLSYEIARLPSTELIAPINRAVFPAYAKLATEGVPALRREYLSVVGMIVLLATPAVLGVACTAPLLVPVVLGPNWLDAVPVLSLLAFYGFTAIVQSNAHAAYLALGRVDLCTRINAASCVVQIVTLVPITMAYGSVGAAAAYLITAVIMIPFLLGIILRVLGIRAREFLSQIWRPIAAAAIMYLGVTQFLHRVGVEATGSTALVRLIAAVALGAAIYLTAAPLLWIASGKPAGAERTVLNKLAGVIGRARLMWQASST